MGLRCLLGHDFTEPETEREREEDGDEMVATVREVKTCRRCGERQIVSENKEVTTIRTPDEVGIDERETAAASDVGGASDAGDASDADDAPDAGEAGVEAEPGPGDPEADERATDPEADDAEILDDDGERDRGEWHDDDRPEDGETPSVEDVRAEGDESEADETEVEGTEPVDDDAEIIDADPGEESWPDHDGEDEGFDAEAGKGETGTDVPFGGGLAPEGEREATGDAADDSTGDAGYVGRDPDVGDLASDAGHIERAEETERTVPGVRAEYFCPNCGTSERADDSSLRPGDICPECRRGYIGEREAGAEP